MQGLYDATDSYLCKPVPWMQFDPRTGGTENLRNLCKWRQSQPVAEGQRMLGCDDGEYIAGYQKYQNKVACCPTGMSQFHAPFVSYRVDGNNEPANQSPTFKLKAPSMGAVNCQNLSTAHTCFDDELMTGINGSRNYYMCMR